MTLADAPYLWPDISRASALVHRIKSIAGKRIVWVMGDQAIVSVGNFLTFNLMARSLPPTQYGAFGVILETILFLNSLQSALVIYPMTIQGAKGGAQRLQKLVAGAIVFTLFLLPLLGAFAVQATRMANAWSVAVIALFAMLMWQLQETTRRALMADMRFRSMVWGDAISYLGQAAAVFLLSRAGWLSIETAFGAMGLTSLGAAALQAGQLRVTMSAASELKEQARECWQLGRWMLLSNLGGIVTSLGFLWTLRISHGLEAVAAYVALFAVTKPANPIASSLCGIITPAVAREASLHGRKASVKIAMKYAVLGCAMVVPPFAMVFCMPEMTLRLLYGTDSPYLANAALLKVALLDYGMMYVCFVASAWLSGLGESKASCEVQGTTVAATVLVALPMTAFFGIPGLLWGALIALTCGVGAAVYSLVRSLKGNGVAAE